MTFLSANTRSATNHRNFLTSLVIVLIWAGSAQAAPALLPGGNNGIASHFPGDSNIQNHPDVLFADNFESYTSAKQLTTKWNDCYQPANTRIATETGHYYSGLKALEFKLPQSTTPIANAIKKNISPTQDKLFARVYTKFDSTYNLPGSNHNGLRLSANYPGPGNAPDGRDFFLVLLQNGMWANASAPGYSQLYVYHPEQASRWGDIWFPDGKVLPGLSFPGFGPYFIPRPNFVPLRNRWYCYELMLKANTAGQRNGRAAFWIDGRLIADFPNLRFRDINTLKIDRAQLTLYAAKCPRLTKKWYDNFVVARSYIGPMSP